ncbi:hypothetical protein QBC39DRAFT_375346 [Podospora conica]|nr:hypothetical protein QBC39DRAFT_375346 [Schizothecium conicum]
MLFAESETGEPEVSFPGGGIYEGKSVVEAALRQADEEIGLVSGEIDIADEAGF